MKNDAPAEVQKLREELSRLRKLQADFTAFNDRALNFVSAAGSAKCDGGLTYPVVEPKRCEQSRTPAAKPSEFWLGQAEDARAMADAIREARAQRLMQESVQIHDAMAKSAPTP
jgi:hypothetical protein